MWILLSGQVNVEEMLRCIDTMDSDESNKPPEKFDRPFMDIKIPDIKRLRSDPVIVKGPTKLEKEGLVRMGFLGRHSGVSL